MFRNAFSPLIWANQMTNAVVRSSQKGRISRISPPLATVAKRGEITWHICQLLHTFVFHDQSEIRLKHPDYEKECCLAEVAGGSEQKLVEICIRARIAGQSQASVAPGRRPRLGYWIRVQVRASGLGEHRSVLVMFYSEAALLYRSYSLDLAPGCGFCSSNHFVPSIRSWAHLEVWDV